MLPDLREALLDDTFKTSIVNDVHRHMAMNQVSLCSTVQRIILKRQEAQYVEIRQVRDEQNRAEIVFQSGTLPDVWFGLPAPVELEADLEKLMKASINTYMAGVFGVSSLLFGIER